MCLSLINERTNERMTFLDDGGEGGSYSSVGGPQFAIDSLVCVSVCLSLINERTNEQMNDLFG